MKVYNYSEVRQNFSTVLNTALKEEVIITRRDGNKFKLISIPDKKRKSKSPIENIKTIKTNVSMKYIVSTIKEGRER